MKISNTQKNILLLMMKLKLYVVIQKNKYFFNLLYYNLVKTFFSNGLKPCKKIFSKALIFFNESPGILYYYSINNVYLNFKFILPKKYLYLIY